MSDDDSRDLTPPELDHTHLTDQTMYKIDVDAASHFEQGGEEIETYPLEDVNQAYGRMIENEARFRAVLEP